MTVSELNNMDISDLKIALTKCCGAQRWVEKVAESRPFQSETRLLEISERIWGECTEADYLEAFTHHPKIGDITTLKEKYGNTKQWAENEQSGVNEADEKLLIDLKEKNETYEQIFHFIFIVFATGKSAKEMLNLLEKRLPNEIEEEIKIAAGEQNKITNLRLKKLLS